MTNNKQQTAVEQLAETLRFTNKEVYAEIYDDINKAKEMEKQQIAKSFDDGDYNYHYSRKTGNDFEDGQEYYNEVYGGDEQ
jgi:ribosomal protein S24E